VYLPRIREEEATIPTLMDLCDIMCFAWKKAMAMVRWWSESSQRYQISLSNSRNDWFQTGTG
jgi:hypothetical protein